MVDVINAHPCWVLAPGPCVSDFTTFWLLVVMVVGIPIAMFVMMYIIPGGQIVSTFFRARLSGSPVIFKWRKDMRVDVFTGEYNNGVLIHKKHGGFLSVLGSYGILPGGFRMANANENYGITIPHQLAKDIQYFMKLGFRNLKEVEDHMVAQEKGILALKSSDGKELSPEDLEKLKKIRESKDYVQYLQKVEDNHAAMMVPFSNIQNFFKQNVNPTYVNGAIERTVTEQLRDNRKIPIGMIMMVSIIMIMVAVVAVMIIAKIDLSAPATAGITNALPSASDAARVILPGAAPGGAAIQ